MATTLLYGLPWLYLSLPWCHCIAVAGKRHLAAHGLGLRPTLSTHSTVNNYHQVNITSVTVSLPVYLIFDVYFSSASNKLSDYFQVALFGGKEDSTPPSGLYTHNEQ